MATSRTGTTRWLHNAAAAKRSARALSHLLRPPHLGRWPTA